MTVSDRIHQLPAPGGRILSFRGGTQTFTLSLPEPKRGDAWLRTNLGHGKTRREEIIREVTHDETRLNKDWFDIPMERLDDRNFQITVGLSEVGHFEAKCFFLPEKQRDPLWPVGDNTAINVEPAHTCCANIIYNAFVRQFGPNKSGGLQQRPAVEDTIRHLDSKGYTVIPPSGTFRDLKKELDFIIGELGCRVIQLLPVYPTPTTYARMGRFGSPYASLSFTSVDPALAEFDPTSTPTEQFVELVDAIHARNAHVILDIAVNHTGWAASLHNSHPEWLVRDKEGRIEAPGAWGVVWEDLTKLDYSKKALWQHMAEVFLLWCRRGVDGFRCDAGYMIPVPAWRYITAVVRRQFPDTVFLLEGLGGKISVTRDILNTANLNWAYSELFQQYDRTQIEHYLNEPLTIGGQDGIMIHFAETHDNPRLAAHSQTYARMRTCLCALCSQQGGFGFANGVEWFATEKINVHQADSLNWGSKENQVHLITRLNLLLKRHPAFHTGVEISMVQQGGGNCIALFRHHPQSGKKLLVLINLDAERPTHAQWRGKLMGALDRPFKDLITERDVSLSGSEEIFSCELEPGQALCLTSDPDDVKLLTGAIGEQTTVPERIMEQCFRAKALEVYSHYNGTGHLGTFRPGQAGRFLAKDPVEYCRSMNSESEEPRVITWQWPRDVKREVMIPPDHFLLVRAEAPFCAKMVDHTGDIELILSKDESLPCEDGSFFVLFLPLPTPLDPRACMLELAVHTAGGSEHIKAPLLCLPDAGNAGVLRRISRPEVSQKSLRLLGTNGRGGMLRAHVSWGKLASKYDALLAANLSPDFPEDRWIMLTRCRAWVVYQGYSADINSDCLYSFQYDDRFGGHWLYHVPCGQGQHVLITISVEMAQGENAVTLTWNRHPSKGDINRLSDSEEIRIIVRPDIEDRNFHETTKAYLGPEHAWPGAIQTEGRGFVFSPNPGRILNVRISEGDFTLEPEWHYMVYHPLEAERGMDPDSDLFSPGYFSTELKGGKSVALWAQVMSSNDDGDLGRGFVLPGKGENFQKTSRKVGLQEALDHAMDAFVVRRNTLSTVIAGYPWFLDWGRDTLIFVRGLIADRKFETAKSILRQFARFEKNGTIPNMIRGEDSANRDTSDAALWFFVACSDLVNGEKNRSFLDTDCEGRTITQILASMAHSLVAGTANGIRMDADSGLIFSPAHFTWMDTNHPAGTPREGYPIEIQAMWFFALSFLSQIDSDQRGAFWRDKAARVKKSVMDLFWLEKEGYLSDCLHASPGVPAGRAAADDALRPNQLLAVTLGAVTDTQMCRRILAACEELLIPGAIRSLADRRVGYSLPVSHQGLILNDPSYPYQGIYEGDEDTRRKPAYHNGTAWTLPFPLYSEAWVKVYGEAGKGTARAWLASSVRLLNEGCVGHLPEILDGNYPHSQRGCDAQAWGVSELLRVWLDMAD